jgi:hypothetical protein
MPFNPTRTAIGRYLAPVTALIVATASLLAVTVALANTKLDSDEIRQRVTGKRIYLAAPLGGEFPLYYRADGRVDGTGEALGLGRFIRPNDSGKWWVRNHKLCQQWTTWYEGKVLCFTLADQGNGRVRWVQDNGDTGIARIGN